MWLFTIRHNASNYFAYIYSLNFCVWFAWYWELPRESLHCLGNYRSSLEIILKNSSHLSKNSFQDEILEIVINCEIV